ncbi:COP1-interacting protein 7 isoform X1 [Cynara cardunculus var. scolymus]|uniref:COP1-interacting protein 7 isoform X1 n=1 Tax=Cynara cardunculus var. scolymus TaxID=59895 RepID=UPI000D62BE21|nr:COP1-interacting protein 7 isoform X1 [Cynara cardunculus var. scolymus]
MKSRTRLDSVVFQLTPTRTRCDLYIIANDKKEKIASGLLSPFIAHLKTAQDQIAEGGYSVLLEPEAGGNATWFTKCTVESFVRFVSTPEILERVYTIESEILQIEEAIAIQGNNDLLIDEQHKKPVASNEGNKSTCDADDEKAIVIYKPGAHETAGSIDKERNSKLQLLNVLETRKTVLKKEQGMAFARAAAAGFDIEHVANLLLFAESFGASRLMSACLKFVDLWKQKHDSGQWVEIAAEDAMSSKSDYSAMNASGVVLSSMTNIHNEPRSEATSETKEKPGSDRNAAGQHTGQFPHPFFAPWAMHSSPGGVPVYQAYPMQELPYYQHYPGSGPFYPPPYPSMEDPHSSGGHRTEQKRQSMDNRYSNPESESVNEESSFGSERHKSAGKSGKKKSGRVVIRNINYINSKRQNSSEDESETVSDTDDDDETESDTHKRSLRSPKRKGNLKESESETVNRKEADSGHWQAFQSYLLKGAAEDGRSANEDIFAMDRDPQTKRRQKTLANDPLAHEERDNDGEGHRIDIQSYDKNGRKIVYRSGNDDFMVGGRLHANVQNSSDLLADNGFEGVTANLDRHGLHAIDGEAMMVSLRSTSGVNDSRTTINMDYEISSNTQNPENKSNRVNFEPHDLSLMPERGLEKRSIGYDPALDYEMQLAEDAASHERKSKEALTDVKKGSKSAEKHQQSKANQATSDKKFGGPIRKGKPSKIINPLEDARARAEKLRSYKADLQKMKKEQQDAEHKRLEALKMERQKRIAARASSMSGQSTVPTKKQLPSKLSPMSNRGSKFTDSEPGSSSPLQRSKIRTTPLGSSNSKKPSTSSKSIDGSNSAGNRLTRSMSSMSDTKKEINPVTPDSKASMTRIRRLSEPKKINSHAATSFKTRSADPVSKPKLSNGPESKRVSAIMNLDRSKAAMLPELKIRTSKVPSKPSQKISGTKETVVKVKDDKHVATSEVVKLNLNERLLHQSDAADNPIIEKTVMLEHKQPSITVGTAARVTKEFDSNHGIGKNIEEDCAASHEVPLSMEIVDKGTISIQLQKDPRSCEARKSSMEELAENPGTRSAEKTYQAPYARVSSFEDPSTRNSDYAKAPQTTFGIASSGGGTEKAYIYDFNNLKLEKIPEVLEKPQVKEAKGFRRLLKLGKKSHSPSDTANGNGYEPDNVTLNDATSGEAVQTLKTLISEDQTPSHAHTSQKSSRHFSLLSPFRGKTKATTT